MRWKGRFLALIGLIAIVGSIVGAGYFLLGFYNVAASQAEPDVVAWALARTRMASVDRHATERPPGSLDDPAMVLVDGPVKLAAERRAREVRL